VIVDWQPVELEGFEDLLPRLGGGNVADAHQQLKEVINAVPGIGMMGFSLVDH
jgi:hypothetical protein